MSLAQVAGPDLTRQAVHLVETGKTRPSRRTLQIIARRIGVPAATFLAGPEHRDLASADSRTGELERLCQTHQYAETVELAQETLQKHSSPRLMAAARHYMGLALVRLGRADDALVHLGQARELFESLDDPWYMAESMDWEAMALYLKEDPRALALAEEALHQYRSLDPRLPGTEARILEHIGTILGRNHSYDRALAHYEEAMQVAGAVRDLARMGRIYHGLSTCYQHLGDLGRATEFAHRALALFSLEHDQTLLARIENELGMLLMRQGQLERAESLFQAAMDHVATSGMDYLRSHGLLSMAELRQAQGRIDQAVELVNQAIELAQRTNEILALATAYQQLAALHALRGADDLVDESFERALAILDRPELAERRAECAAAYVSARTGGGRAAGSWGVSARTS